MQMNNLFGLSGNSDFNNHILRLIIGVIAFSLAPLVNYLAGGELTSISKGYHEGGLARDVFVGFLFIIAAYLFSYEGYSNTQKVLSFIAGIASIGIAIFPCSCGINENSNCSSSMNINDSLHYASAAIMFGILTYFCFTFYKCAIVKPSWQSTFRACVYILCAIVMVVSIAIVIIDFSLDEVWSKHYVQLVYYCEYAALIAFGTAWLFASRMLPLITAKYERIRIF